MVPRRAQNVKVAGARDLSAIDPIREAGLKDHLKNPNGGIETAASTKAMDAMAIEDFQLYESLNILHTMEYENLKP